MKGCRQHASPKCKNLGSLSLSSFPRFPAVGEFLGEGGIEFPFPPHKVLFRREGKMRSSRKEGRGGRVNQRTAGRSRSRSRSRGNITSSKPLPRPTWHLVPLPRLIPKNILVYIYPSSLPPSVPRARSFLLCERETSSIFESFSEIAIVLFVSALLPAAAVRRRILEEEEKEEEKRGFSISSPLALAPASIAQPVSAIDSLCVVVTCI